MRENPYTAQGEHAFWKRGVEMGDVHAPTNIYCPKWKIAPSDTIATMGSCFAQHIARWLRKSGFIVPHYEKTTREDGGNVYSANYGNVYTVRQALQLVEEALGLRAPSEIAWEKDAHYIDAFRPQAFKAGFGSAGDVERERRAHLSAVRTLISDFDVLVFTLGLTEAWRIHACGSVLPTAPGVVGGRYDPETYEFVNFTYVEIMDDLKRLCERLGSSRGGKPFKLLLTVSPVPLTATATSEHVLVASTYSKSVLRAVAGDFVRENHFADYFPSFEIISNPAARGDFFEANLRTVKPSAVEKVMKVFSRAALTLPAEDDQGDDEAGEAFNADCEDALLEGFADNAVEARPVRGAPGELPPRDVEIVVVGNSHLTSFKRAIRPVLANAGMSDFFFPVTWGGFRWSAFDENGCLTEFSAIGKYAEYLEPVKVVNPKILILVGLDVGGSAVITPHGALRQGHDGCDGRSISPSLPIIDRVEGALVATYKPNAQRIARIARQLDRESPYDKVFWIAEPDMCVEAAQFRFGIEFVNSGSYKFYKQAYREAWDGELREYRKLKFLFHGEGLLCDRTGYSRNEYRMNEKPWDIHCNDRYFEPMVEELARQFVP